MKKMKIGAKEFLKFGRYAREGFEEGIENPNKELTEKVKKWADKVIKGGEYMHIEKCPYCGSNDIAHIALPEDNVDFKIIHCFGCYNDIRVHENGFFRILTTETPNASYSFGFLKFCEKVANEAISFFGAANQKTKAVEELAELQKEICKDLTGEGNADNIIEEISDVCFMILQLIQIYNFNVDDIIHELSHKIARLQTRMKI